MPYLSPTYRLHFDGGRTLQRGPDTRECQRAGGGGGRGARHGRRAAAAHLHHLHHHRGLRELPRVPRHLHKQVVFSKNLFHEGKILDVTKCTTTCGDVEM